MELEIDFGDDATTYTIPHQLAFKWLEEAVCAKFHGSGRFDTATKVDAYSDGKAVFTISVRQRTSES